MSIEVRPLLPGEHDQLFAAFAVIVDDLEGFPQAPPLSRDQFDDYWLAHTNGVWIAEMDNALIGAYYLKPNFVGRAAHIANAGYFVTASHRGLGVGKMLVEHSFGTALHLGFDALQFNLVFESNPARAMYERLGFKEIGRIPEAVDGQDAVIYWRGLEVQAP